MAQPAQIPDFDAMASTEHEAIRRSGQEAAELASLMSEAFRAPDYEPFRAPDYERSILERVSLQIAQRVSAGEPPPLNEPPHLADSNETVL